MKVKISISIDEETLALIEENIKNRVFRNKSHLIELATQKFLEEVGEEK